jgi:hypothetical protein
MDVEHAYAQRMAVCALVLAACGFLVLPVISSVLAVVLAHVARRMYRAHPDYGRGDVALAALVLGWIGVVASILWLTVF